MLSTVSEKKLQVIRWAIFLAWALLIFSLFYDPVSSVLTRPESNWSPLADKWIATANDPARCIDAQGYCIALEPYALGTRVFWGMVVPSAIFVVLVFGHEFWRRICPLYFFSQLPRALGMKPLMDINRNQWLQNNHLYVQFVLFFLGITARILLVNSVRPAAGAFLVVTLLLAAGVVMLYGGRSWCHYVCPFGMVQTVFTGPRGLLDSTAHEAAPYSLTQSMCRVVKTIEAVETAEGAGAPKEQSDCVSCKSACMDIDAELAYWETLRKPGRRLVQYGYLGLVIGYFCYYGLYAGNFDYYFSGVWSHESRAIAALFDPGFYLWGRTIALPKLIAAPLTLAAFAAISYWICMRLERWYRGHLKQKDAADATEKSLHRMFSVCTFLAFNFFFVYGGRPEINHWPVAAQFGFQALIMGVSSLWLSRTWGRSSKQYHIEKMAIKRRQQLQKLSLNVSELLGEQSLNNLSADKLDVLVQVLPEIDRAWQAQYNNVKEDSGDLPRTVIKHRDIRQQDIRQQDIRQQDIRQQDIRQQDIRQQDIRQQDIRQQDIRYQELGLPSDYTVLPKTRLRRG